jgi:hypothetical protein
MKVFISHSTKDKEIVDRIIDKLKSIGIEPYVAESDIQPGTILWEKLETNIKNSNCVLAIVTKDASMSKTVNQEIAAANALKIPVVPIVEKGVHPEGVLAGKEYIVFDKNYPNQALINASKYLSSLKVKEESKEIIVILVFAVLLIWLLSQSGK